MSKKTLRWSLGAENDLAEIVEHIVREDSLGALKLGLEIVDKAELLESFPYLGSIFPYYRRARYLTHKGFVIYYTVHRREVVIRAVARGSRRFQSSWMRRPD